MTMLTLGIALAIKGALVVWLSKIGAWPDWDKLAAEKREEKEVLLAYKEWRKNRAAQPSAEPASDRGALN
jgi:hypothetical protein